ncbi:MAG: tetraacyldisaccharide 4'-kinase [Thermonema sp.]|uniref:tetraacyldisaccharide 4'-kinase n=1 Tax=Thermonema sp. TaxID=2231181 RepID=UPI0021DDBDD7|nr:tetraacyldisaccharide 4'-kinase [Thermonema sp.]GIV38239.1 MAG: tetraacyldisaccharide 4'-kinase [Thermonema sp.]
MTHPLVYWLRRTVGWLFVPLYGLAVWLRHQLYDRHLLKSKKAPVPTLCIGNLTVGGTGKTPHTEYFIETFSRQYRVGVVSRGYKRQSRGIVVAHAATTAEEIGDEPYQIWMKYQKKISGLSVGSRRVQAIRALLRAHPETGLVILDDAFQHRALKADVYVLLCDYYRPFYKDYLLPAGNLRDLRSQAERAHLVVVSKCPAQLSVQEQTYIKQQIGRYAPGKPVFFSTYAYGPARAIWQTDLPCGPPVVLLSGIATPGLFEKAAIDCGFLVKEHIAFPDHHHYDEAALRKVLHSLKKHGTTSLLTTEKDFAKIKNLPLWKQELQGTGCYYLPLEIRWLGTSPVEPVRQLLQLT